MQASCRACACSVFPDDVLCVGTCGGDAFQPDRNFWSYADAPPYAWAPLEDSGFKVNYRFDAIGTQN